MQQGPFSLESRYEPDVFLMAYVRLIRLLQITETRTASSVEGISSAAVPTIGALVTFIRLT